MKTLIAGAALMIGASSAAFAAPVVIDDFAIEKAVMYQSACGIPTSSEVAAASAIGGYRDMSVTSNATRPFGK